jgi:dCTP deaminase
MILSDADIKQRMAEGDLELKPLSDPEIQIQPGSVDLRLGTRFCEFDMKDINRIDPQNDDDIRDYGREVTVEVGDAYELEPGAFVLGTTRETVRLPDDIAGILIGRSSFGRLGIVANTGAGYVDPGFEGQLTLELTNHGPFTVVLRPAEIRIIQVVLFATTSAAETPYGERLDSKYQKQVGPSQSHLDGDW